MGRLFNKIKFAFMTLSFVLLFGALFIGVSTNNVKAEANASLITTSSYKISNKDSSMATITEDDVRSLTAYASYNKYYQAEVTEGEKVSFNTVTKYVYRLYLKALDRAADGEPLKGYRVNLSDFYQYWYQYSDFETETSTKISADRVTEIKTAYDDILAYADENDIADTNNMATIKTKIESLVAMLEEDASKLEALNVYAKELEIAKKEETVVEKSHYYLSYNKFIAAENPDNIKLIAYTEVAKQIGNLLAEGIRRYEAGEENYYEPFSNSYGYWYETSGFERKTMAYISGSRVTAVELQFAAAKSAASGKKTVAEIQTEVDKLVEMLNHDGAELDSQNGYIEVKVEKHNIYWRKINTTEQEWQTLVSLSSLSGYDTTSSKTVEVAIDKANQNVIWRYTDGTWATVKSLSDLGVSSSNVAWLTFIGCFTIIIREGLEAILILGAIIAYLIKSGNKKQTKHVYIGAALAVVASFALAALLYGISSTGISTAVPQEIIEGVTALIAVVVLVYVTNWMISKAESTAWTNYISNKVSTGASKGSIFTLAFTSFLAVFREGAEVVLFYQPLISSASEVNNGMLAIFGGMILGLLVVAAVFVVIRVFGIKIPLKPFFVITSILMAGMAIIFLGAGIWELFIDGGLLAQWGWPSGIITSIAWMSENEVLNFLGIYPTWWTIIPQIILTIVTVITFILWIRKGKKDAEAAKAMASVENKESLDDTKEKVEESSEETTTDEKSLEETNNDSSTEESSETESKEEDEKQIEDKDSSNE